MPPADYPNPNPSRNPGSNVVTINVGGELFQTSAETLALAGPASPLSSLASSSAAAAAAVPFLDRDPHIFSLLLSFLRLRRAPSSASPADLDDLLSEALFFSLPPDLLSLLSSSASSSSSSPSPSALLPSLSLPLPGRLPPSAISATSAALAVAHGGAVSSFDPTLLRRRRAAALAPFPAVDSLLALSPSLAAAGATDFPGLHLLPLLPHHPRSDSPPLRVLHWFPNPSTNSTVQAVGASPDALFVSFESSRRNASAVLAYDLATFDPVVEIGRKEIFGAELDSAIPAAKLRWVAEFGLLMAAGSHAGPSGLSGNISLWDIRSNKAVWDIKERSIDCFADVAVSDGLRAMFKVGVNSGEVFMADLRKLGAEEPWVCLGDKRKVETGKKEGSGCLIECYGQHVFCTRGGEVEFWTEVVMGARREGGPEEERVMRKNWMGRAKDRGGKKITHLAFGGNRMVLARKDEQCVEVWESCTRGV